ncbi:hypothetical protein HanPI659440_Chr01g0019691 [Helianthus annuus]|nr:hypothetical protein HanPI659440_Chr01g0019691 [Helianthus annuus]
MSSAGTSSRANRKRGRDTCSVVYRRVMRCWMMRSRAGCSEDDSLYLLFIFFIFMLFLIPVYWFVLEHVKQVGCDFGDG